LNKLARPVCEMGLKGEGKSERLEMGARPQGPLLDYWRPGFPGLGRFAEAVGDFNEAA